MKNSCLLLSSIFLLLCLCPLFLQSRKIFDMSHKLGAESRHKIEKFNHSKEYNPHGTRYAIRRFCAQEDASTHVIAPYAAFDLNWQVDQIPNERLIAPLIVITITENRILTRTDIENWEKKNVRITPGTVVVLNSGWSSKWDDTNRGMVSNTEQDYSGFELSACIYLRQKVVFGVGVDTPHVDGSQHEKGRPQCLNALAMDNVYVMENLKVDYDIPTTGAIIFVAPLKMQVATASPARIIAVVDLDED